MNPSLQAHEHLRRGLEASRKGQLTEAERHYVAALKLVPHHHEAMHLLGLLKAQQESYASAADWIERSVALRADNALAWNNLGNVRRAMNDLQSALDCYERAVANKPGYAVALENRALVEQLLERPEAALRSFREAWLSTGSEHLYAGAVLEMQMRLCEWDDFDASIEALKLRIAACTELMLPFPLLALFDDPDLHLMSARSNVGRRFPPDSRLGSLAPPTPKHRIRLAYFSADFHAHATALLMAEFFEKHDKCRFETFAFSFGPDSADPMRQRLVAAFDHFIDVRDMDDLTVARLARSMAIDIAVDLKGFTQNSRIAIFALRSAPIQVNFLGYPGTMGTAYHDYILADHEVIPNESRNSFSEAVVRVPGCYQPNDSQRRIDVPVFRREEVGLPKQGFVFCCFNANYKITQPVFTLWMQILEQVPESVLWLYCPHPVAIGNLRAQAARLSIDTRRLVFAQNLPHPQHLARYRLADLFLDTFPCTAHTTASDALWMGLPVLTRRGRSFASRVASSLLKAVDLPELVTEDAEAYRNLAVELAHAPARMLAIREKLAEESSRAQLFKAETLTRNVEAAFVQMHQRYMAGLVPQSFDVPPEAGQF